MRPVAFQIDPQDLAAIVPDCYQEFRPIVADGLTFFLQQLPASRLAEVFEQQAQLPADVDLPRRLVVFLHACPALHKIGQVLARNRHLDPDLRRHLQELEKLEPRTPMAELRPTLDRELAPAIDRYRIRIAERALAEGSVAVVVPVTWSNSGCTGGSPMQQGVAKLLKPGIAQKLDEDLEILGRLASYLDDRQAAYHLPPLAYRELLDEVAELLSHEVQLANEQTYLRQAADQYANRPDVHIPRLLPFCTDAVTAMERVYGHQLTDPLATSAWQRSEQFHTTVRALLSTVFFSRQESVLFHGDPHGGNLMATRDGRLAIIDWSLAGHLTANDRVQLAQILVGAWARDAARITSAIASLTSSTGCWPVVPEALAKLAWYSQPGFSWAIDLLDALARAGVRFPSRLLLFRKAFLTLQGVLADLCPHCSLETTLMADALSHFAWEWPLRWCKPPSERNYATHMSNADLVHVMWQLLSRSAQPAVTFATTRP
jgi:ubiquinone biosynthesis protein